MTPRDKIMRDIFKELRLEVWSNWNDAYSRAKAKGETDGYASFLANSWMDFRESNMGELLKHGRLT